MSGRHIIIAQDRGYAVIVLSVAEVRALYLLVLAGLADGDRAQLAVGVSRHGGLSSVEAGRRAAEILAGALADMRRAVGRPAPPEDDVGSDG
jgi:hypothetical protein